MYQGAESMDTINLKYFPCYESFLFKSSGLFYKLWARSPDLVCRFVGSCSRAPLAAKPSYFGGSFTSTTLRSTRESEYIIVAAYQRRRWEDGSKCSGARAVCAAVVHTRDVLPKLLVLSGKSSENATSER